MVDDLIQLMTAAKSLCGRTYFLQGLQWNEL
jgi:hypothetical protein